MVSSGWITHNISWIKAEIVHLAFLWHPVAPYEASALQNYLWLNQKFVGLFALYRRTAYIWRTPCWALYFTLAWKTTCTWRTNYWTLSFTLSWRDHHLLAWVQVDSLLLPSAPFLKGFCWTKLDMEKSSNAWFGLLLLFYAPWQILISIS